MQIGPRLHIKTLVVVVLLMAFWFMAMHQLGVF